MSDKFSATIKLGTLVYVWLKKNRNGTASVSRGPEKGYHCYVLSVAGRLNRNSKEIPKCP